ncbi:MAG: efflux RND transporter permease subunit [Saprospiraceae bacterium]
MIIGVYYIGKLPIQSFPKTTVETLDVQIDWGSQIGVSENEERIMQLYSVLKKDVINCSAHVGEYQYLLSDQDQHVNECLLKVNIKANKDIEISQIIRDYFEKNHQDVTYIISPSKTIFDYIINTDVYPFSLYISERSRLESPNTSIISKVREALDTYDIKTAAPSTQSYLALKIDWEKAGIYHVNPEQIIQTLQSLFGNYYVTDLRSSEQYVPVYLSSKDKQVNKEIINSTTITNGLNQTLPLSEFISWSIEDNYKTITADRVGEMVELGIGQYDQRLTEITDNLRRQFNTLEIRTGGQHLENVKMIAELKFIFMIAICLLYLILASQFESLVLPFIVLISVPVSAAGGLTVLYFAGHSVNILSMTGLIIMSGIVINDSILKVDMLKMGIKNGLSLQEATVAAGEKRFSAIIMTSMTTILEFVPMFFSSGLGVEIQVPMGIVLISGIIIGTFLSLSLIPVLFSYYYYFTK